MRHLNLSLHVHAKINQKVPTDMGDKITSFRHDVIDQNTIT